MSSRGGMANSRGKRGGARGGARGGGRGGRGGASSGPRSPQGASPAQSQRVVSPEQDRVRREQDEVRRLEQEAARIEAEKREEEERQKRSEIERLQQEEVRKRAAEMRRRQEEEAAKRAREDATRREKLRLEEQRRRQEENIKRQREAASREEQERQREYEFLQQKLRSDKEATLQNLASERANRERIEALRKEVEARSVVSPLKRKADVPVRAPVQRPRLSLIRGHSAAFQPENDLDYQVLDVYAQRQPVEGNLPSVPFTKKADGLYFLGQRKCVIESVDGIAQVKLGQQYQDFQTWLEKTEKVEALRMRGTATTKNILNIQQATGFVF